MYARDIHMQAEHYEKMRPGYMQELYDDIFRLISIGPGK